MLSHFQAIPILEARQEGRLTAATSTDLGLTTTEIRLRPDGILFAGGEFLPWQAVEKVAQSGVACFTLEDGAPKQIRGYSELSGLTYSLMPTVSAPTLLISGIPMHRIKDTDPYRDTLSKIKSIAPIRGRVLDTATGLGYTAIQAARTAESVITIEIDPAAQDIARFNPWSRTLFDDPKITRIIGDSYEEIQRFDDESFACILHDPPMLTLAGDLYSEAFYRQAFRVLQGNGRMFHYIGDPDSKTGARATKGVAQRLREAGFARVVGKPGAFGVVAYKSH